MFIEKDGTTIINEDRKIEDSSNLLNFVTFK